MCGVVCAGWRLTSYPAYACGVVCAGWRLTSYPAYACGVVCAGWRLTSYPAYAAVSSVGLISAAHQARPEHIADSKKAPLGRFFTLVGRAGFEPATN
ncbi:hypothetical protein DPS38_09730 [Salmonella enterica subsp. enterica serovar Berkeley]|nr:hypothetical protein [Salmonella enterica subsp. enterica serovar Berkeley]